MEMKVLEESKTRLLFNLEGSTHSFCNILSEELKTDNHIKIASYAIGHPLIDVPKFLVETDGKETPKDALKDATKRIQKNNEKFKKAFEKA